MPARLIVVRPEIASLKEATIGDSAAAATHTRAAHQHAFMGVTDEEIIEIQLECFADDVDIIPGMTAWTRAEVEAFFQSNGEVKPVGNSKSLSFAVVHEPRVAIRKSPSSNADIAASLTSGTVVEGTLHADDTNWLLLADGRGYVMISHPSLGALIEAVRAPVVGAKPAHSDADALSADANAAAPAPAVAANSGGASLQRTFDLSITRKACGANLKVVDASGAARDSLFDHFVMQELLHDFRHAFRNESSTPPTHPPTAIGSLAQTLSFRRGPLPTCSACAWRSAAWRAPEDCVRVASSDFAVRVRVCACGAVPDEYCSSDTATDLECITYVQMGGQILPIPDKKGRRKPPAGGVRQRIEHLGGLRCLVCEKDDGSDEVPLAIVVLAHGIHVLSDDLFGLAYHLARPRVRFILPGGCEASSDYKPNADDAPLRPSRQWFAWHEGDGPAVLEPKLDAAAAKLAACAAAAHAQAPEATLVLGGFSQGAAVALQAVVATPTLRPAALIQLAAQAPLAAELPPRTLNGVRVLVVAGKHDPIAPIAAAEKLHGACTSAGAVSAPLVMYDGAHEVTLEAVHAMGKLLAELLSNGSSETAVDLA